MTVNGGDLRTRPGGEEYEKVLRPHLPYAPEAPLESDAVLADLGLDSLSVVSLLVDIETSYGVEFPDELLTAETFATVGSLWAALSSVVDQQTVGG